MQLIVTTSVSFTVDVNGEDTHNKRVKDALEQARRKLGQMVAQPLIGVLEKNLHVEQ